MIKYILHTDLFLIIILINYYLINYKFLFFLLHAVVLSIFILYFKI